MSEFYGPIVNNQDRNFPLNQGTGFQPFACGLNGSMTPHGADESEFEKATKADTSKPTKVMTDGITIFLLETEMPLQLTDWAFDSAMKNVKGKSRSKSKL